MKCTHLLSLLFASLTLNAQAQPPAPAPEAPVPQGILSARTVFISNAMPLYGDMSGGPTRGYNQFYADVKAAGRYEVVDDPSKADLVFEIQTTMLEFGDSGLDGVRLLIYDRKTHYVLWTLAHQIGTCALKKGCDKNLDLAINGLSRDLEALSRHPISAASH
jgi:hypothetical protein